MVSDLAFVVYPQRPDRGLQCGYLGKADTHERNTVTGERKKKVKSIVAKYDEIESEQVVLEALGIPGNGDTLVMESAVLAALNLEPKERQEAVRASGPVKIQPGTRVKLAAIVNWAREKREQERGGGISEAPSKVERAGRSRVRLIWPDDSVSYMESTDFLAAQSGKIPYAAPAVSYDEKVAKAQELREIMKSLFPNCALCGGEIDDYQPELAMINEMLRGGVLKESGLRPEKGRDEFTVEYRRLDIWCRFWDPEYTDLAVEISINPELDIDKELERRAQNVAKKVAEKRPEEGTELNALLALKKIRIHLSTKY